MAIKAKTQLTASHGVYGGLQASRRHWGHGGTGRGSRAGVGAERRLVESNVEGPGRPRERRSVGGTARGKVAGRGVAQLGGACPAAWGIA